MLWEELNSQLCCRTGRACGREGKSLWERGYNVFASDIPWNGPSLQLIWDLLPRKASYNHRVGLMRGTAFCFSCRSCHFLYKRSEGLWLVQWREDDAVISWRYISPGTGVPALAESNIQDPAETGAASDRHADSPASPTECSTTWWLSSLLWGSCMSKLLQAEKEIKPQLSTPWATPSNQFVKCTEESHWPFY